MHKNANIAWLLSRNAGIKITTLHSIFKCVEVVYMKSIII